MDAVLWAGLSETLLTPPLSPQLAMEQEVDGMLRHLTDAMESGGLPALAREVREMREKVRDVTAQVAVTGPPGVGKTTFITTALRLSAEAAATLQQAPKPASCAQPGQPRAVFWELPAIDEASFCADAYLRQVDAGQYTGFLILSCAEFSREILRLASELRSMGKPFCLIRSKIDLRRRCYRKRQFADEVLCALRREPLPHLDLEYAVGRLFHVDCRDSEDFDFKPCVQALQDASPSALLRHCLLVSLSYLSNKFQLKTSLKQLTPIWAIHSLVVDPVGSAGLPYPVNARFLVDEIYLYRLILGIDFQTLRLQAQRLRLPAFVLSDELCAGLPCALSEVDVVAELNKWTSLKVPVANSKLKWVPLLRQLPGGLLSGAAVIRLLDFMVTQYMIDVYRIESKIAAVLRGD
ncbi:interferon-inducible GTPase 5-like [Hypanus sabinus]|uniref:interferon-inducible GTPase 5-like n=1 Tax=Hypanus sabinus TaxID=79690 RepID=UPI0028C4778D|nr:interferon-inducible GTPase 5-like [Hypanus sabinus]